MITLLAILVGSALAVLVLVAAVLLPHQHKTTRGAIDRYTRWGRRFVTSAAVVVIAGGGAIPYLWYRGHPEFADPFVLFTGSVALLSGAILIGANRAAAVRVNRFLERDSETAPDPESGTADAPATPPTTGAVAKPGGKGKHGKKRKAVAAVEAPVAAGAEAAPAHTPAPPGGSEEIPCPTCGHLLEGMAPGCPKCKTEFDWE